MRLALFIPKFTNKLGWDGSVRHSDYMEERLHLFATMMAIYPFTNNEEIQREFMITKQELRFWAWFYGVKKNKQYRRQICIDNGRLQFLKNLWAKKKEGL